MPKNSEIHRIWKKQMNNVCFTLVFFQFEQVVYTIEFDRDDPR
ncbi:MAG: hypothetical protein WCK53_16050 [Methanomicrobiales archaeon]